jgi:hypothetical protein
MRNLLFVLVFISIILLGCGGNKSPLENCADEKWIKYEAGSVAEFIKKPLKEKLKTSIYYIVHHQECEKERTVYPRTFDAKYQ